MLLDILDYTLYIVSCQWEMKIHSHVTFDDQNNKYVFASKGTTLCILVQISNNIKFFNAN